VRIGRLLSLEVVIFGLANLSFHVQTVYLWLMTRPRETSFQERVQ
jgi:hypothetical protein